MNFRVPACQLKPPLFYFSIERRGQVTQMHFLHPAAPVANHILRPGMTVAGMADGKNIKAADIVNETFRLPEFEGAVDRRRLRSITHGRDDIIGTQGPRRPRQYLQHDTPRVGITMPRAFAVMAGDVDQCLIHTAILYQRIALANAGN